MSSLSITIPFFTISRVFLFLRSWVVPKISWNICFFCSGGNSKVMDCDACDGWRRKILFLWVLSGVLGSMWFCCGIEKNVLLVARVLGGLLNVGKNKLPTLASLLSTLDQEFKALFQIVESLKNEEEFTRRLLRVLLKIIGWMLAGIMLVFKPSLLHPKLWKYSKKVGFQQKQLLQSSRVGGRWGKGLLFLGVIAGVFISIWIFWTMHSNVVTRRVETLVNMCDERARMLQDQFNVSMNHVHALAIMISTFHHGKHPSAIDQKTFARYTARTSFERPLTSGVAYALKVLHPQREEFEKQHGWTIKKMVTEGHSPVQNEYLPENLDPSPVQDEYAPVIFSQETVAHIVSIDMMSGKEDRENILRARASGKGVLTSPFRLLKSNHLGVVLTFALYKSDLPPSSKQEERIEATVGYLGASFDVETLVEKLLEQLASKQTIVVNVYDTTDPSAPIKMYGPDTENNDLMHTSSLEFGDPFRKHEMHCRFKQKPPFPWSATTTSLGVAVIVFLLGHIFHAAISRIEKVEDDFREMRELKVRAEAADIAKSQFLATVSHEIRTPMNGVLGMLHMLMDTELDATQQDYAITAQASGKALITLINEVLDQAKIESGRLELEEVSFDVRAVLDNVLSLFSDKSRYKGIELAVYISDRVPEYIIGDPGRFRQIITNLVGNSIKFTDQGHIFVSVHLLEDAQNSANNEIIYGDADFNKATDISCNTLSGFPVVDKRKSWQSFNTNIEVADRINLLVTVEDTGVGIPKDAQSRIFMPFMQADSSTSRTYGGTGIGLSISKCLVDLMGGQIGFVSEAGIGSTFAFSAAFKGQQNLIDKKRHQNDTVGTEFRGMRGLVIDSRYMHAEVTKYHLQRLGVHVELAIKPKSLISSISDACFSSATGQLDMVLVDKDNLIIEKGQTFTTLLADLWENTRIKSLDNPPKIFLLVTSLNLLEAEEIKAAGFIDNVIMKPLRLSNIIACLRKAFGVGKKSQHEKDQPFALQNLLRGKQILVVDDNLVNRRVAAAALKKYGAVVTCAESGKDAVEYLKPPHNFDACFMDIQMPEMDGFQATRHIRSLETKFNDEITPAELSNASEHKFVNWHVPILAMTADVFQATHDECIRCGMDGYVSKPFEEEQLYLAVAQFLSGNSEAGFRR